MTPPPLPPPKAVKPGQLTSEWKLTIAAQVQGLVIIAVAALLGRWQVIPEDAATLIVLGSLARMGISEAGYAVSRGIAKR